MRRSRAAAFRLLLAASTVGAIFRPETAFAQKDDGDSAKRLYNQGSADFLAKRYTEALVSLRQSYDLVPSPNSGLIIARCLRELDRPVEAVEMYETVAAAARKEAKYAQTAEAATAEGAAVRSKLGTVHVRLATPSPGARIVIDGVAFSLKNGEAETLHASGDVTVRFEPSSGSPQSQRGTLVQGGHLRMEFTPSETPAPITPKSKQPPLPPPVDEGSPPGWTGPAAIVAGGVALVGTGLFVGFGLQSNSIYDELNAKNCGSAKADCGTAEQSRADEGKRDQTIANVSLGVGIVGAAAAVTFLLVRAFGPRTTATAVVPGSVRVRF